MSVRSYAAGPRGWRVTRPLARRLAFCLLLSLGFGCSSAGAAAAAVAGPSGGGSVLEDGLVVPGVQALDGDQQVLDAREAGWDSSAAFVGRERSRSEFRGLSARQALPVAARAFPGLVGEIEGGLPQIPGGGRIVAFPADDAAQVLLPGGKHGLVVSTQPIAAQVAGGRRVPVDLALTDAAGGFAPRAPAVGVRIPRRVGAGVVLPASGVSLTPVDTQGEPLGGAEGIADGAAVGYANTQTDSDTWAKPLPGGFELDSVLRSPESPEELFFRVGLPAGSRLVGVRGRAGTVEVAGRSGAVAVISAASAVDAEGRPVPLSMGVAGDVIRLTVAHRSDEFRYPIVVDPTVEEVGEKYGKTWAYSGDFVAQENGNGLRDSWPNGANAGQDGSFYYKTQGESKIYSLTATSDGVMGSDRMEDLLGIFNVHSGALEAHQSWVGSYGPEASTLCSESGCATGGVSSANDESEVVYQQYARESFSESGRSELWAARVGIVQEAPPVVEWSKASPDVEKNWPNPLAEGRWIQARHWESLGLESFDPGVGLLAVSWRSPQDPEWGSKVSHKPVDGAVQTGECEAIKCGQRPLAISPEGLPEGEDTVEAEVEDGVGLKAKASAVVKIDDKPPYDLHLEDVPANAEFPRGEDTVLASATDGSGSTPSSGVAKMYLRIDNTTIAVAKGGSCSPGPCTATGEFLFNGEQFPTGENEVEIEAIDGAGNSESESVGTFKFASSETKPVGPGTVDLSSGEFKLATSDVSIEAAGSGLSLERSYESMNLAAGAEGPLGPQWQLALGGSEKLTKWANGSVVLTAASGDSSIFTRPAQGGPTFVSPAGDPNLTLKEESASAFVLGDQDGDVTRFTVPEGGSGTVLTPSAREEPGHSGTASYKFQTVDGVVEPTLELAPVPSGVSCATLERGCRALTFVYASKTTAGEAPSEWGEYDGRLMTVDFTAYNPAKGSMQTLPVAQYAYDKQGRLRAEWNPQIEPELKTIYGYDAEGHVTALTPPGQQPWLIHYGTIESDPSSGRLLSVSRPPATATLGNYAAPVISKAPTPSTSTPQAGGEVSTSKGQWSGEPLTYSYQWEDCNPEGLECAVIPGATSPTYTTRYRDEGRELKALVTATNAGGSTTAQSTPSSWVPGFPPTYGMRFAEEGRGKGRLEDPSYLAIPEIKVNGSPEGIEGALYITDTKTGQVEEYTAAGGYRGPLTAAKLSEPTGIAALEGSFEREVIVAENGKETSDRQLVWLNEQGNRSRGAREELKIAAAQAVSGATRLGGMEYGGKPYVSDYRLWTTQTGTSSGVECYEPLIWGARRCELERLGDSGSGKLTKPGDVAVSEFNHELYVTDSATDRVERFTEEGEYLGSFGEPGSGPGQFEEPQGVAVDPHNGHVFVVDSKNGRVEEFLPAGRYLAQFGENSEKAILEATGKKPTTKWKKEHPPLPEQLTRPIGIAFGGQQWWNGLIYVVDSGDGRVVVWEAPELHPPEGPLPAQGAPETYGDAVWTMEYKVPVSGAGAPNAMGASEVAKWGQSESNAPSEATAILPPEHQMGWPAKEYEDATIFYLDANGHTVNVATPGGGISTTEYNSENDVTRTLSADARAQALKEGSTGAELATEYTYNSLGTELQSTTGPEHAVMLPGGREVQARKLTKYSYDEDPPAGNTHQLVTKQTTAALTSDGEEDDVHTTTTSYSGQGELGWKLGKPTSVTADVGGLNLTHTTLYEGEGSGAYGSAYETRLPANPNEPSPHASETVYYTAGTNSKSSACGEHPEWVNLPCQTRPARQPETSGLPGLPVTTTTYNIWDEPEVATETIETKSGKGTEMVTRTRTETYDAAGRPTGAMTTSTVGQPLASVSDTYNTQTGALEKLSTSEGTITNTYNTLGQLQSYEDADGNTATYKYNLAGQLKQLTDGKGSQTYTYSETTGELTKLTDSAAGTFTASYDPEGRILSEGYPNGMTAEYTYNILGEPANVEYKKAGVTLYSDSVTPSIEGRWMSQTSTLSKESYSYDGAGRLVEVQDTPAGKGCVTRLYAYDADSNRTSLTTRQPTPSGTCASSGGTVESHSYDQADRLIDSGVAYNPFGDITALPRADAGGSELTSSYYVDGQLHSMTQHESETQPEETIGYTLDPERRTSETTATGGLKTSALINHYDTPGNTPAWSTNGSGTEWARNIQGINGQLAAIQYNGETPTIQIANLHGDIVATAKDETAASGLASTVGEPSEYGVPASDAPPKYAWLGAIELPTELPSGIVSMGARAYDPQLGRFLQPDPDPSGSPNAYAYTFGDPLNETDPTGDYAEYNIGGPSAALLAWMSEHSAEVIAQQAAENAAARAAAERAALEAQAALETAYGPSAEGGEEDEEESEEEGGYEYIADHQAQESGKREAHTESAILVQPLTSEESGSSESEESGSSESATRLASTVPLCNADSELPCARDAKGGPGATCGRNSPEHRRCRSHWKGGSHGPTVGEVANEVLEWTGVAECIKDDGDCPDFGGMPGVIRR